MTVFYNGSFYSDDQIDFFPHVFDSHQGFFTTLKFANNKIYFLNYHIQRLKNTAAYMNFDFVEYNFEYIIRHLVQMNNLKSARVRIMIYNPYKIRCLITVSKLDTISESITLKTKSQERDSSDYKYKLLKNLDNYKLLDRAKAKGYNDWLFIDSKGYLMEATFSNIFLIYNNRIFTPPDSQPILPGVIRKVLLENNMINDYKVIAKPIHYSEIKNFDEAFITNSIKGVVPIKRIDKFSYQTKRVTAIIKKLDI